MYYLVNFRFREQRGKWTVNGYTKIYSRLGMARRVFFRISNSLARKGYSIVEENIGSEIMYRMFSSDNELVVIMIIPSTMVG